jgi:hypothetical protein
MSSAQGPISCDECGYHLGEYDFDCIEPKGVLIWMDPAVKQTYPFRRKRVVRTQSQAEATGLEVGGQWMEQAAITICPRCETAVMCEWEVDERAFARNRKPGQLQR